MRAALLLLLALLGCEESDDTTPARAPAPAAAARSAQEVKDCRDQCEQSQIAAGQADDRGLRACRARCGGTAANLPSAPAHEVPRSISRAPAVHAPPAVRPLQR